MNYFLAGHYGSAGWPARCTGVTDNLYFSLATCTSLGYGEIYPAGGLRLIAGIETVTGLMMIGCSASFTYLTMEKFWGLHGPRQR